VPPFTFSRLLVLIAVVIFALATFGVALGGLQMVALGLAIWAAASLVP
jgi:hypothetical protein